MNKWIAEFDLEDGDTMPEHMDLEYKGAKIDFHCKPLEQEPCENCIDREEVKKFVEYIQTIKDNHNEKGNPINYGTICDIVIYGHRLLDSSNEVDE